MEHGVKNCAMLANGPPPKNVDVFSHYVDIAMTLTDIALTGSAAICDRLHIGELVYGPIYRGASGITRQQARSIESILNTCAVIVHCRLSPDEAKRRMRARDGGLPDAKSGAKLEDANKLAIAFDAEFRALELPFIELDMSKDVDINAEALAEYDSGRTSDVYKIVLPTRLGDTLVLNSGDSDATFVDQTIGGNSNEYAASERVDYSSKDHEPPRLQYSTSYARNLERDGSTGRGVVPQGMDNFRSGVQLDGAVSSGSQTVRGTSRQNDRRGDASRIDQKGSKDLTDELTPTFVDAGVPYFDNFDTMYRYALRLVLRNGKDAGPRGMAVRELVFPTTLCLTDPHDVLIGSIARRPNYRFGMAEACWILSGSDDASIISEFNSQMMNYSDDGRVMWGAYGPRLIGQLNHVIATLRRDSDSRQALLTTWRPMINAQLDVLESAQKVRTAASGAVVTPADGAPSWNGTSWMSKDVPCTVAWHFQLRNNRLNLTVFMRSNDAWLGLPYDTLSFTTVQRAVASAIGVIPGVYTLVASNLHLYDRNIEDALKVVNEDPIERPRLPTFRTALRWLSADQLATVFDGALNGTSTKFDGVDPYIACIRGVRELCPPVYDFMRSVRR
jgi:thymidylate synthase